MRSSAVLALAGALASVQAQRLDTGFLTGPELTALSAGNFAWGGIESGDTSIMSLEHILAELDAITGDYPYSYYSPYAYYPPPLTIPRPYSGFSDLVNNVNLLLPKLTVQYDGLTGPANCSASGGRVQYLNNDTTAEVETDTRTQVTFISPLDVIGKNCQFGFFLGNTSTVTGSGRFTMYQNENPTTSYPTTDPPTISVSGEQTERATYQARIADLATLVSPTTGDVFLIGANTACPAPGTVVALELRRWDDPEDIASTIAWNGIFSGRAIKYTFPPPSPPPPPPPPRA